MSTPAAPRVHIIIREGHAFPNKREVTGTWLGLSLLGYQVRSDDTQRVISFAPGSVASIEWAEEPPRDILDLSASEPGLDRQTALAIERLAERLDDFAERLDQIERGRPTPATDDALLARIVRLENGVNVNGGTLQRVTDESTKLHAKTGLRLRDLDDLVARLRRDFNGLSAQVARLLAAEAQEGEDLVTIDRIGEQGAKPEGVGEGWDR